MLRTTLSKGKLLKTLQFAILFVLSTSLAMAESPLWEGVKAGTSSFFSGFRRLNPGVMVDEYNGWHGVEVQAQLREVMVERHFALQEKYDTNAAGSFLLETVASPYYAVYTGRDIAFGTELSTSEYLMATSSALMSTAGHLTLVRSATGFNPGWARSSAGNLYYSNRIHLSPGERLQYSTRRLNRRFVPDFDELEQRTQLSANAEVLTPWRSRPGTFSSAAYISEADFKGAKLGKFIGQGEFNFVFHIENLEVANTPLVFRTAKVPHNPYLINTPSSGHLAGMYALADKQYSFHHPMGRRYRRANWTKDEQLFSIAPDPRNEGLLYGYLDFYRGSEPWRAYKRRGVIPPAEQWELLGDQLFHSAQNGIILEDLHLNNIIEGYIVDFFHKVATPEDALRASMKSYQEISERMDLKVPPVPFPVP